MHLNKAIIPLAFVFFLALCARAEDASDDVKFTTGTSVENLEAGALDVNLDDKGEENGDKYWSWATDSTNRATVTAYGAGEAYDYAAKGTVRNKLFSKEPTADPGQNLQYLDLDLEGALDRCVMPRDGNDVTNVLVKTAAYDGIYADTLVKFTASVCEPAVDDPSAYEGDKIVVWLREETDDDGTVRTNLMVTAGRYDGDFKAVTVAHYVIAQPAVKAGEWVRLTVRAISDVTGGTAGAVGAKAPGFTVFIDGQPAVADGTYDIGAETLEHSDWLTPEARALIGQRRLFPWIARAGYDRALELSRFSFDGLGAIDDVSFSTESPSHAKSENVFTLKWDAGVVKFDAVVAVSNGTSVTKTEIAVDATELPRYRDFALGTNSYARVLVTNVVYATALDYSNGVWSAQNGCTVTNCTKTGGEFVYDGTDGNPIGMVASTRKIVEVDGAIFTTFAEAKKYAKEQGIRTIALATNMVGCSTLFIGEGEDYVLDLCGHTLQGDGDPAATISQTGGKLQITDSSSAQTGRILPPAVKDPAAVRCYSSTGTSPTLVLTAGWYDGAVVVTGKQDRCYAGTCIVEGGSFTNVYGETQSFYLEQYVTNSSQYFGLGGQDCWTTTESDAFIWCGAGEDDRWTTAENWKGGCVPGASDLVIFPRTGDEAKKWSVDFGEGVTITNLLMDADVAMSGTNEFSHVKVKSGSGRFVGTGTAAFTGALPGKLTADGDGSGEIRLGPAWRGTVRIAKIVKAKILTDITWWGNVNSKVEFAGVRGYLSSKASYALPYELVLTDDGETSAWKNDTGYTGSIVSFPRITGTGTFESPKNTRDVLQVFQFKDVEDFTGKFNLGGKRLLLGKGSASASAPAGSFTFADAVKVRSNLEWTGVTAHFGAALGVYGAVGETLMSYTGSAPSVSSVTVTLYDRTTGEATGTCYLSASSGKVTLASDAVTIGKTSVSAASVGTSVKAGETLEIPAGSAVAIVGNDVIVNGRIFSTVADYYKVTPLGTSAYAVAFDEKKATPSLAEFTVASGGDTAVVTVTNAKPGLWYGLQSVASLAEDWESAEVEWKQASGDTVEFTPETSDASAFYRGIMTDKNPNGGAK